MSATTLTFAPGSFMTDHVSSRARFRKAAEPVQAPKALTSVELLARARAGDDLALNDLCARYLPRLQKWAHGRLPQWARGGAVETVDIVHDTLAQVVQRLGTFEPRHDGAFQAFLRTSLHNRICDQIRWAKRRPTDALATDRPDEGPSPFELAIGVEARERYEAALQRLKAPENNPSNETTVDPKDRRGSEPRTWGHFLILGRIGGGSFGTVYRAHDTKLQCDIALKLIRQDDGAANVLRVFKEARLLARVHHGNVVTVN